MQSNNPTAIVPPTAHSPFKQTYFHGTKADLKIGDLIATGNTSN